ncbi:putative protein-lysine deacylase ABHD14B isoform X2 [Cherax quadricarinatus]|uniref:putative protein-lysine deacylase ABHD14B isoform X2 n=1 Tax=Cherax quadricarinatus TaxID=27406 RepID=UPI002379BEEB|nr:putative protein-lysine deacylase ABHD14B isoform X2 [Cherax quadricarinatus]
MMTQDVNTDCYCSIRAAPKHLTRDTSGRTMAEPSFWRNFDFTSEKIPSQVTNAAPLVKVTNNTINIMGSNTFYREAQPPEGVASSGEVVVLLHGAAFQSKTWLDLNTINLLAAMGHHIIAVDLPGFGKTQSAQIDEPADYLHTFMTSLRITQVILVSPSMSGRFSIPFIMKYPEDLGGYVPVAPVSTSLIVPDASKLSVPTLIISGEKDQGLGHTSRDDLLNIPSSQHVEIPGAKHPAYLDDPILFHTLLYNFINQVHAHRAIA